MIVISTRKNDPYLQYAMSVHYTRPKSPPPGRIITHIFREELGSVDAILSYGWAPFIKVLLERFSIEQLSNMTVANNWLFHRYEHAPLKASEYLIMSIRKLPENIRYVVTFVPVSKEGLCYKIAGFQQIGITKGYTVRFKRKKRNGRKVIVGKLVRRVEPKRILLYTRERKAI